MKHMAFGGNIVAARVSKGMTRPELAKKIGRSYQHVYGIEREHNSADPAILTRIAEAVGLPIEMVMRPAEWQEVA